MTSTDQSYKKLRFFFYSKPLGDLKQIQNFSFKKNPELLLDARKEDGFITISLYDRRKITLRESFSSFFRNFCHEAFIKIVGEKQDLYIYNFWSWHAEIHIRSIPGKIILDFRNIPYTDSDEKIPLQEYDADEFWYALWKASDAYMALYTKALKSKNFDLHPSAKALYETAQDLRMKWAEHSDSTIRFRTNSG